IVDPEVCEFGNMDEAFLTGQALNKATKLLDAAHNATAGVADFDLCREHADFLESARPGLRRVCADIDAARVVRLHVDLSARYVCDAANRLTTGANKQTDLVWLDLDVLDARGIWIQL